VSEPMPAILRGDARNLPLLDDSVDLVVTSPPYFGLRSYQDGGRHYDGQIGAESNPAAFVDALIDVTRECLRVLKPSGSLFVNLGDKYNSAASMQNGSTGGLNTARIDGDPQKVIEASRGSALGMFPTKSLLGIPWRYALRCIDDLDLILRAEMIWSKPNGLPESVTDRVRRSHEQWFHFVQSPRYYSAVDEIREQHASAKPHVGGLTKRGVGTYCGTVHKSQGMWDGSVNSLGKLPGSVWEIPTQPLQVPASLGVDHFAAFPMEWPRRLILGWSPREICTACGEGLRPVVDKVTTGHNNGRRRDKHGVGAGMGRISADWDRVKAIHPDQITGYACACPDASAVGTPGVVLDPFGGTGTTALVATMLGRIGISIDASGDYCRLAEWRARDPKERARAAGLNPDAVARIQPEVAGQGSIFDIPGAVDSPA
jgi:DNA modification methylase